MAKKKKTPASKKPSKKASKKPARKKARRAASSEPTPVATGRGDGPLELGRRLVRMFNSRTPDDHIWDELFAPSFESVEGHGVAMAWAGRKAVKAKSDWWMSEHAVHAASVEGPFVGATGFAVRFTMDVETRSTGERMVTREVGVYTVKNGKVVREEFMYDVSGA